MSVELFLYVEYRWGISARVNHSLTIWRLKNRPHQIKSHMYIASNVYFLRDGMVNLVQSIFCVCSIWLMALTNRFKLSEVWVKCVRVERPIVKRCCGLLLVLFIYDHSHKYVAGVFYENGFFRALPFMC